MAESVSLADVPETMLWTLHSRACEAQRRDTILHDPEAVRIYRSIDYDFARNFGRPEGIHAMRSRLFDDAIRPWLRRHPIGTVVELGAGLETAFQRCDNGTVHWVCVDVPEAVAVRARFLPATSRCRYLARSALDPAWLDEIEPGPVFVTAQGLFMYFEPDAVRTLITAVLERFDDVEIMFDAIPPWFSRRTEKGYGKTEHYTAPPMPWGITFSDLRRQIPRWSPRIESVEVTHYGPARGPLARIKPFFGEIPVLRDLPPTITRIRTGPT